MIAGSIERTLIERTLATGPLGRARQRPLRAAGPADTDRLRDFVCRPSPQSRYFRFFASVAPPSTGLLRALCGASGSADILLLTDSRGDVIGHGMAADARSSRHRAGSHDRGSAHGASSSSIEANIGLVIADEWQGCGLGTVLLGLLVSRAAGRGVDALVLDVLPANDRMRGIIARRWPDAPAERTRDALIIRPPIGPCRRRERSGSANDRHAVPRPGAIVMPPPKPEVLVRQTDQLPRQPAAAARRQRSYDWDDPAAAAAAAREQDGASFLQAILDGTLPGAPIAHTLDFRPVSVRPGVVAFEFTPAEFHYNPIGSVHGGMMATLCDSACGCAVQSMLPAGQLLHQPGPEREVPAPGNIRLRADDLRGYGHSHRWPVGPRAGQADRHRRQALRARDQQLHDLPPPPATNRMRPDCERASVRE